MTKKKNWILVIIAIIIFVSFFVPRETKPSPTTRVIIENTYKTYIAPPCFEQSNPTNWIEDGTLQKAKELHYEPHSSCTEDALKGEMDRLFTSLLKEIGILENKWRNW